MGARDQGARRLVASAWLALAAGCGETSDVDAGAPDVPRAVADAAATDVTRDDASADAGATKDAPPPDDPSWQPPPLSGGTLAVTRDGATAVAADPDGDRVLLVDLRTRAVTALALRPGDEPGRVALDDAGRAHVALRGGGAVVAVDLATHALGERRAVCPMPRGIAWDAAADALHVACAGGELVTLPAAGGPATRTLRPDRDLRDVVVQGNRLLVTRFRAAETLVLDERGDVTQRIAAPVGMGQSAAVAWRASPSSRGGFWLLYQRSGTAPVPLQMSGSYSTTTSSACEGTGGITRPGVAWVRPPLAPVTLPDVPASPLVVDVATSPSGDRVALAAAGNLGAAGRAQLIEAPTATQPMCFTTNAVAQPPRGQVVAVAYTPGGELVAQTRAPAALFLPSSQTLVPLGGFAADHAGHRLFHTNPTGLVACASCHPEGDDDGRTWAFDPIGPRRTQPLRGHLLGSEPFHWDGDQRDLRALIAEVMVRRMGAPEATDAQAASLARWLDALPARPTPAPDASAARGGQLFRDPAVGCAACHAGPRFTSNQSVDVGTGGTFQVPTLLGLAWRAPYMHDGCARTLRDRFTDARCGGGDAHGRTSHLTPAQVADLVAYLETL